jgi:hypothetical protein
VAGAGVGEIRSADVPALFVWLLRVQEFGLVWW